MIFLVVIFFVAALVGSLAYIDNANIKKIEDFLHHQQCLEINYTKGNYQAICNDKVVIVENAFSVDLSKADTIYYKMIKDVESKEKKLFVKTDYETTTLEFKDDAIKEDFFKKLEEKRK